MTLGMDATWLKCSFFKALARLQSSSSTPSLAKTMTTNDDGQQGTTTQKTPEMLFRGTEKKTPKVLKRCFGGGTEKKIVTQKCFF